MLSRVVCDTEVWLLVLTIDMLAKDGSPITDEQILQAELAANEVIWRNVPVVTTWFDTAEEALSMPVRKEIKFGEDISVVTVGSVDAPLDCCACCGTHPSTTGQVGLVTVLKAENYKGMTRMTIKAGRPAFEEARTRSKIASQLAQKYSCEVITLLDREAANDAKNDEVRRELSELKSALSKQEEEKLEAAVARFASAVSKTEASSPKVMANIPGSVYASRLRRLVVWEEVVANNWNWVKRSGVEMFSKMLAFRSCLARFTNHRTLSSSMSAIVAPSQGEASNGPILYAPRSTSIPSRLAYISNNNCAGSEHFARINDVEIFFRKAVSFG